MSAESILGRSPKRGRPGREPRTGFYVLYADKEINNGGFAQYFYNGHGEYAEDTVKANRRCLRDGEMVECVGCM